MFSRSVALSAALALTANAFLLPPDVAIEGVSSGSPGALGVVDPFTQLLKVPCPGCQFARMTENGIVWEQGGEKSLLMNISVGSDPTTLEMNSVQFYPPVMELSLLPTMPGVPHVDASASMDDLRSHPGDYISSPHPITAWSINALRADTVSDDGHELLEIEVQVSSLAGTRVPVPRIEIQAIKDPEARLMIAAIRIADPDAPRPCHSHPLVCRWRDLVTGHAHRLGHKLSSLCGGRPARPHRIDGGAHRGPHVRPHRIDDGEHRGPHARPHRIDGGEHRGPHARPHHHHGGEGRHRYGGHGGHHEHHRSHMHGFVRAVRWVLFALVIPFMAGATAAAAIYIMSVAVGVCVASLWRWARGTRGGAYRPVSLEDGVEPEGYGKEVEVAEEAELDVDEAGEAPPRYVDAVEKE